MCVCEYACTCACVHAHVFRAAGAGAHVCRAAGAGAVAGAGAAGVGAGAGAGAGGGAFSAHHCSPTHKTLSSPNPEQPRSLKVKYILNNTGTTPEGKTRYLPGMISEKYGTIRTLKHQTSLSLVHWLVRYSIWLLKK